MILNKKIILASTSRYRAEQLGRLQLPFEIARPGVDETPRGNESAPQLAMRLAGEKAYVVGRSHSGRDVVVIGADQVAELQGGMGANGHENLGKPGTRDKAREQLQSMRGREVIFHSGLALYDCGNDLLSSVLVPTYVTMRDYTDAQIEHYLDHEDALDCAGSAKSEGLGVALIATMRSDDPTALVGLPLIALTTLLAKAGIDTLAKR